MENIANKIKALGSYVKNNKTKTALLTLVILVSAMGIMLYLGRPTSKTQSQQFPTITLEEMDLKQFSSAIGVTQSENSHNVSTELPYKITKVFVKEGEWVKKGEILAQLDTSELDKKISDTKASIESAQKADNLALSQAERVLSEANSARTSNYEANNKSVQEALFALDTAQSKLNNIEIMLSSFATEVSIKKNQWDNAKSTYGLNEADGPHLTSYDNGYTEWHAYRTAITNYDNAAQLHGLSDAQSAVKAANTNYETAVKTRDITYKNDTTSINNAKENVNTSKSKDSAASYKTLLNSYLEEKANCTIKSPINGTVTVMNAKVGNKVSGLSASSTLFVVEDTNNLEVSVVVPEYDAVIIERNMEVEITSDAVANKNWAGIVKSISPKATDLNSNFTIIIKINSEVENLAIGMSAKVNIITESKKNVFAIPYDAIAVDEMGQQIIYALVDGVSTAIKVTTGMETDYYVEITANELKNGMKIMADPNGKNTSNNNTSNMFRGGF